MATTGNVIDGIYNGKSTKNIATGAIEDIAWGIAGYKLGKITGAFLKTNTNSGFNRRGLYLSSVNHMDKKL